MIQSLRKRHRQAWLLLALVLPVGILFAWLAIPNQLPVKLLRMKQPDLFPVTLRANDKGNYNVALRTNSSNTRWQLEWNNKKVLDHPSAVIFKIPLDTSEPFNPENAEFVGRIEAKGSYVFELSVDSSDFQRLSLLLFDFIHQKVIDTINL